MGTGILTLLIRTERDVVVARQRSRQIAHLLGFEDQDQTRIATAVSEIARNALMYAGGGKVEYLLEGATLPQRFAVRVSDQGPGIGDLRAILEGQHTSKSGLGVGITGAQRLVDTFSIESTPGGGTTVLLEKNLPRRGAPVTASDLLRLAEELAQRQLHNPFVEIPDLLT